MSPFRSTHLLLFCGFFYFADAAPVSVVSVDRAPNGKQYLPPLSGYIAVYIRPGDTPLEDINTELAEAFKYYNRQNFVSVGRSLNDIQSADQTAKFQSKKQRRAKTSVGLDDIEEKEEPKQKTDNQEESVNGKKHIQKIPKQP